jgi:AraC-like DNA-binding protein
MSGGPDRKASTLPNALFLDMPPPPALLLVDDNPELLSLLKEELSGPHRVRVATGPEEAWDQLQSDPPDLLVCDARIPGTGPALCRRVQRTEEVPSIPIVLLGTPDDPEAEEDADVPPAHAVADAVLDKPFSVDDLRECLEWYLPSWERPALADEESAFLKQVAQTVERRLHDPDFTVAALAEAMDLSQRHLARRLRAEADTSPAKFIRTRRIERAKALLENDPDTVQATREAVGFRSASHFSQVFREAVGIPPSTYRDKNADSL